MDRVVAEGERVALAVRRLAWQIAERAPNEPFALVGILPRGLPVAEAIHAQLQTILPSPPLLGRLDVTLWRDDLHHREKLRVPQRTELPFPIEGQKVWLVDDVLYTGRTVRAALDALRELGRPAWVRLAVLVDRRGLREVPIAPDCAGFVLDTAPEEKVLVRFTESPSIRIYLPNAAHSI